MATFDYGRMSGTAKRLMSRFAQGSVTVTRETEGEIDPATPWIEVPPTVTEVFRIDAAVKGVSEQYINGTTIVATDLEVTCSDQMTLVTVNGDAVTPAASPFDTSLASTMRVDGKPLQIIKTMRIPAAGVAIAWKFIARS